MPITPFHFGPGLLGKGFAARWYSWTAFVAANVGIDFESLYYLSRDEWPVHRQLHTFLGAGVMGIVTALLLIGARALVPALHGRLQAASPAVRAEVSTVGIVVGAMVGALSHPVLDGLMHHDIEPLQPWSAHNPLRGLVELGVLHRGCMIAGLVGAGLLLVVWRRRGTR